MSNSGTPEQNGWNNAPWESSLSHGSLNEPSATTSGQPESPSPFSRQGSDPADALGADPQAATPGSTQPAGPTDQAAAAASWPTYPGSQPSAPNFDPQPTAPYGGGYAPPAQSAPSTGAYGSNPYETNPYETNPYQPAPNVGGNPYEVNPYQATYGGYGAYGIVPTMHPQATPALITGILGLVICPLVGIIGLVLGNKARKEIDAEPGRYSGRGQATAGFVLGILSVAYTLLLVLFIVAGAAGSFDT
jgi:hypothetical protein